MQKCQLLRNRETEAGAAGLAIARAFDTMKRLQHGAKLGRWNAWPAIAYGDRDATGRFGR